jgi:predicted lactoylglutathione lyase
MVSNIFVNLPVKDLERSKKFFTQLGFTFNAQFTDENAACLVLGPNIYAMLLVEKFFITFTPKTLTDTRSSTEVITALFVDKQDEVDRMADNALKSGGSFFRDAQDMGFMYGRSFQDPDGHLWEVGWMDPKHVLPV